MHTTTSLCRTCKKSIPAEVTERDGKIVMTKTCAEHGAETQVVAHDVAWYKQVMTEPAVTEAPSHRHEPENGCPYDCGPCTQHEQRLHLPIVPITSACNLDCPICYTHNKNEGAYHITEEGMRQLLRHVREAAPDRRIINITGGEPTQHPALATILRAAKSEGISRITLSTHGLRLLKEQSLVDLMQELDVRVILSFDSFDEETNQKMLGGEFASGKLRVLDVLESHGVSTTLLPVIARGYNEHEIGQMISLALDKDFIRSVELHTMTYTGQSGANFDESGRMTGDEVLHEIEKQTEGRMRSTDFVPSPLAHPLCYQTCYLLRVGPDRWLPFARFMPRQELRSLLGLGLYLAPGQALEDVFKDIINRLWIGEIECAESEEVLAALRKLLDGVFAEGLSEQERLQAAEMHTKAVYVHAHMDEATFDTDRIRQCCVGVRDESGRNIPSCAYNVLYRERDERFAPKPMPSVHALGRGRLPVIA